MTDWKDDDDLMNSPDPDTRPLIGVSHMGLDDSMTLAFEDAGEKIDTKYGPSVGFDAELVETDGRPTDDGGSVIEPDTAVRFMTDSSRLLPKLAQVELPGTVEIVREGTGYDSAYSVIPE
jgi:hypothetical protein